MKGQLTTALALVLVTAIPAAAQDARSRLADKTRQGDRLTIDTRDRSTIKGRLLTAGEDVVTIESIAGPVSIPYSNIDRVRRKRNGVLLGSVIGLGVGIACGIPLKMLVDNETGEGTNALITVSAIGLGIGMATDALLSVNRTIYRRSTATIGLELAPVPRGATAGVRVQW